jgi:hypothetical protein
MDRDTDSPDRADVDPERLVPEAAREPQAGPLSRERNTVEWRGYRYQLSPADIETLQEVGRFRTVALPDLARYRYRGHAADMREDLASLREQGLLQSRTIWTHRKAGDPDKFTVVVLTKTGKELLEQNRPKGATQKLFAGFVKPAEVRHDAAIYRMYQLEAERLQRAGNHIRRTVLDYELKQKVYKPLAKARTLPPLEYARRQAEIAAQNGLKVVRGRILLPDLRIEYETRSGERAHVDLELATDHYRGAHMRGKAEAGFKFYAPRDSVSRLASAFDPELVAQIFSL